MKVIEWSNFPLPLIQVNPPSIIDTNLHIEAAYKNGIFSNSGQLQRLASDRIAQTFGPNYAGYLASSNTMALVACLLNVGVRGRHVVISNFTFAATVHAVILAGGIPVLCDVNQRTLELDSMSLKLILGSTQMNVAAVVPTRVFGYVNDISEIVSISRERDIPVIADSAASLASKPGKWVFECEALYEVFSLHATKVFGIGEGGFVLGQPKDIEEIRSRANFGLSTSSMSKFRDGLNAKADEFTAARALSRLKTYDEDVEKRQHFVNMYKAIFSKYKFIGLLQDNTSTIFSYFPIIFHTEKQLLYFNFKVNPYFTTRRYYFPTISQGYSGDAHIVGDWNLELSNSIALRILCLPVYVSCTIEVMEKIQQLITETLDEIK